MYGGYPLGTRGYERGLKQHNSWMTIARVVNISPV